VTDIGWGSVRVRAEAEPSAVSPATPPVRRGFASPRAAAAGDGGLLPALVLIALLALVATYAAVSLLSAALGEQFRDDLAAARYSAGKSMVRLEENSLRLLREMTYTEGVEDAVAAGDAERLEALLAPIAANSQVPYTDVLRADGAELLALRSPELGADAAQQVDPATNTWGPFQAVLRGDADAQGDKYAEVVDASWGPAFATAAPVRRDDRLSGAIGVAFPLGEVASRLSDDSGSHGVTLYRLDGGVLVSTVRASPEALQRGWRLPPGDAERIVAGDQLVLRQVSAEGTPFVETVGVLTIRQRPALLLGISSPAAIVDRTTATVRNWMLAIFAGAAALTVLARLLSGRRRGTNARHDQRAGGQATEADDGVQGASGDGR